MRDIKNLTDMEFDAIKEIGNIGSGHIATALSKLLSKSVDITIPDTKFIGIDDFSDYLGGPEQIISSIYLQIKGDLKGEVMFVFPIKGALEIIDLILQLPSGTTKKIDESVLSKSAFKELSVILTGSFLNALSKMLDIKILPSIPAVATDMTQAVIDMILIKIGSYSDNILSIGTRIDVLGHDINGKFVILFDKESLFLMLDRLHEKFG